MKSNAEVKNLIETFKKNPQAVSKLLSDIELLNSEQKNKDL